MTSDKDETEDKPAEASVVPRADADSATPRAGLKTIGLGNSEFS